MSVVIGLISNGVKSFASKSNVQRRTYNSKYKCATQRMMRRDIKMTSRKSLKTLKLTKAKTALRVGVRNKVGEIEVEKYFCKPLKLEAGS